MKNKLFLIFYIIFVLGCIAGDILVGYHFKFNISFYYSTIFFILGIALGNLLFLIIHLLVDSTYTFKKYVPIMHASYLVIAALMYYAIEWGKNYDKFYIAYWSILGGAILIDLIVFIILIIKSPKDENKPKFKVNQRQ